jgi:hypothetical protein
MLNQIYLPYENFRQSIDCYDDLLLLETLKTMRLVWPCVRSEYHQPINNNAARIRREWIKHAEAFAYFRHRCYIEAKARGMPVRQRFADEAKQAAPRRYLKPHWIGWAERHARHRANLLVIGACVTLAKRYAQWKNCNPRGDVFRRFLSSYTPYREWHALDTHSVNMLHQVLDCDGAATYYGNHYERFGWAEQPTSEPLGVPRHGDYHAY